MRRNRQSERTERRVERKRERKKEGSTKVDVPWCCSTEVIFKINGGIRKTF